MSDQLETIAAILAKMRKRVIGEDGIRYMLSADEVLSFLNSIEVAIKRERALLDANVKRVRELEAMLDGAASTILGCAIKDKRSAAPGNAAAMREALEQALVYCESDQKSGIAYSDNDVLVPMLRAALVAPARNCDVGTAEEQAHRFHAFCSDNTSEIEGMCNSTCPCIDCWDKCHCLCVWSQMPFAPAEGGAK